MEKEASITERHIWRHGYSLMLAVTIIALFAIAEPAHAQAWAEKTKSIAEDIVKGLRMICYPVALGTGVWIVISMWMGSKRFQDMVPWIIGAALLIALPDLVKLIPTS